jgi:hypothetical protein
MRRYYLLKISKQSHLKVNQDEHEEEELTSVIFGRRIIKKTITKKITSGTMITENKGMQEISVELL